MVITICEGYNKSYVILISGDERFKKEYGEHIHVPTNNIYKELDTIALWVNNEFDEECLFEID